MAISKKYSRRITVDGVVYRWLIARRPTAAEFDYAGAMTAMVQLAETRGALLFVNCGLRAGNVLGAPGAVVTPRRIANTIRTALAAGWNREVVGTTFRIALQVEKADA